MLLVPTRQRMSLLRRFCDSAIVTRTTCPALLLIDSKDYGENIKEYSEIELCHFPNKDWKFQITEAEGMGPKVREVWPSLEKCDWVGILNDDHVLVTPEWDKRLIKQLNGKNFVTCNDHWNAPARASGATMFSMPLLKAFGFPMFPKQVDHLGIDDVFETIGKATGCWDIDMSVIVEHWHAYKRVTKLEDFSDPSIIDDTHAKVYGRGPWVGSPQAMECEKSLKDFFENDCGAVIERVRALQDAVPELPQEHDWTHVVHK